MWKNGHGWLLGNVVVKCRDDGLVGKGFLGDMNITNVLVHMPADGANTASR